MSIASRITSIEEHIGNAYDSINKFGVDTSVINKNIENIANVINDDIYDKLPKVTQSGAGFTLENVQNGQVDDFKMVGTDLEQDTTTGKNLLNISDITSGNGIKNNNNKSITLNGNITSTSFTLTNPITLKANATYIMSLTNNDTNAGDSTFILRNGNTNKMSIYFKNLVSNAPFTPTEDIIIDTLRIYNSGVTFNNYTFSIQLEEGSSSTNFEPYTNGASPNPDYPQEIKVVEGRQVITDKGKNLFDKDNITKLNGTININSNDFEGGGLNYAVCISCKPNTTYTVTKRNDGNTNRFALASSETIPSSTISELTPVLNKIRDNDSSTLTLTTEISANYLIVQYYRSAESILTEQQILDSIQIEESSTATNYEPYYNPVSYNIDLHGKNVFNLEKYPFTPKVAYSSTGYQELNWTGYSGIKDYFPINGNTTYSFSNSTGLDIYYGLVFYDKNKTIISNITAHTTTFTTPSNCEYIRFSIHTEELPTWVQIEEGSTTTNYEEYYDYKLAKMPNTTYKNRIYKNNGNWYYERNVEKYIIDGTESWTTQSAYSGYYRYMFVLMENYKNDNLSYGVVGMNSHFIQRITQPHGDYEYLYLQAANNNLLSVYIQIKNLSTIANFKTWLSENNVVVWYVLANPVTTQITNATLINQLEAISVHTGTNIITISNDNNIIPEIEITRLKELEKLA